MMQGDNFAVSPTTNAAYYRVAAASSGTAAYTLLQTIAGPNGIGYLVSFVGSANDSGKTLTIVGHKMGTAPGVVTTEVVTGPNTNTVYSTGYFDRITSITPSATMTGTIGIGVLGTSVALPRTRIKGVYYVGTATAGSVKANLNSATGTLLLQVDTPASATASQYVFLTGGILVGGSNALGPLTMDFGIVTLTNITFSTIICG
jgi:hypothetical protein